MSYMAMLAALEVAARVKSVRHGKALVVDWHCSYCGRCVENKHENCLGCGAAKPEAHILEA